mgnify:CR=1 FL=1
MQWVHYSRDQKKEKKRNKEKMQSTLLNIFGTLCLACQLLHVDELKTTFFVMDYNLNIAKFRPERDEGSEGLENYEVVKTIKAGSAIRSLNLRPARLVKRGTKVQLKILAQGMLVIATVEALEDGYIGQQIKLLNNASGKTVTGVVTGLNEVSGL